MEQQSENDELVEQLAQRQTELVQASNDIQMLQLHGIQAAEEIEASYFVTLLLPRVFLCCVLLLHCHINSNIINKHRHITLDYHSETMSLG